MQDIPDTIHGRVNNVSPGSALTGIHEFIAASIKPRLIQYTLLLFLQTYKVAKRAYRH